jgi:hypothetical protein
MFRLAISCVGQPFYILSTISYCVSHFILCRPFYIVLAIFMLFQQLHALSAISMLCQSLYFSVRYFIYIVSHSLVTFFLLYVLQVYHLDNLLSNVPVPAGIPRC